MSLKEDLIAMREWLTPPGRWCQRVAWKNPEGQYTDKRGNVASACLYGSFFMIADSETFAAPIGNPRYEAMIKMLNDHCPMYERWPTPFVGFNDAAGRTQEEILALLDRCIADCEPQAKVSVTAPVMERELEPA